MEATLLPTFLLALVSLFVIPLFPGDSPARLIPDPPLPVHVYAATPPAATALGTSGTDSYDTSVRLVERVAEYLRARHLTVTTSSPSDFVVSATPASSTTTTGPAEPSNRPSMVKLSIGFNSSSIAAASGTETRFGGDGDFAWRLAHEVQRNVTGGLRDVLGYEVNDRGAQEVAATPVSGSALGSSGGDQWVTIYPLFSTNSFEELLISSPGSIEVMAVAISNAIADYLDPSVQTPKRVSQTGWALAPSSWQPVDPWAIYQAESSSKVALTFDGGASSVPTPAILKALKDAGVRATMFMTADFVERNPDLVVQMARDGHEFGNHSATHPDMTTISDQEIVEELDRLDASVQALTGKSTRPWFRPPFGAVNDRVLRVAADHGYYAVMWTTDSADWRSDIEASTVASRMLRYTEPGSIMVEHLGSPQSAEVLASVLKTLQERGLTFGTLSEVIGER